MTRISNLFIGSSSEGKDVAERLHAGLDRHGLTESTVWTHGVFRPSSHPLATLVSSAQKSDFAVMVLSPDDNVESRESKSQAPRDNVIFELGLFMGALGPERTYMVLPRGVDLKLPSDLAGITYLRYPIRQDGNVAAALNGVVLEITDEVRKIGPRDRSFDTSLAPTEETTTPGKKLPPREDPSLHPAPASPNSVRDLKADLEILRSNLTPQGWSFKLNAAGTTLRVKSPRGTQHVLKIGQPQRAQEDFDRFLRELRSGGARFDATLRGRQKV